MPLRLLDSACARVKTDLLRDARAAARAAHLRYVTDAEPGIQRRGAPKRFRYVNAAGHVVRDGSTLERIRQLAIPPAWQQVWICPSEAGHLQATGIDARGRKQYRYHPDFRRLRDGAKYEDILPFVRALPELRRRVRRDLKPGALTKNGVLAVVVRLMETTRMRVGNERYAAENGSYGVTTLRNRHAKIRGETLELVFRGKAGKVWHASVRDKKLAAAAKRCRDLPGQLLFQYLDAQGRCHPVSSTDVNAYIGEAMGKPFTAKAFRTWAATLRASTELFACPECASARIAKRTLNEATRRVADALGNTLAVCRKSYVDPFVFDCFLDGDFHARFARALSDARRHPVRDLTIQENAVRLLLESRKKEAPSRALAA